MNFKSRTDYAQQNGYGTTQRTLDLSMLSRPWSPGSGEPGSNEVRQYLDHTDVWTVDGKVACITSQPYGLHPFAFSQLAADAERFGFEVDVDMQAWHSPDALLIEMRAVPKPEKPAADTYGDLVTAHAE